jgi:hypothetical protein
MVHADWLAPDSMWMAPTYFNCNNNIIESRPATTTDAPSYYGIPKIFFLKAISIFATSVVAHFVSPILFSLTGDSPNL